MSNFSSLLGLSGATLQRLGDAYEGYAAATGVSLRQQIEGEAHDPGRGDQEMVAGSCYVLAAVYRSILDPAASIPLFGVASGIYRRQNHSFWKILSICGFSREWLFGQEASRVEASPQEFLYELLRQYYLFNCGDENALGRLLEYASSLPSLLAWPVGNPPIPLREYIAFIRGDIEKGYYRDEQGADPRAWASPLRNLLQRTAEQLQLMQSNRFQWANEIGLLPFEPDILATLLCFAIRKRNREDFRYFFGQESQRGNPVAFLGDLAMEMIGALK